MAGLFAAVTAEIGSPAGLWHRKASIEVPTLLATHCVLVAGPGFRGRAAPVVVVERISVLRPGEPPPVSSIPRARLDGAAAVAALAFAGAPQLALAFAGISSGPVWLARGAAVLVELAPVAAREALFVGSSGSFVR